MSKVYKNDYGHDLRISVGKDLTDVVETKLLVRKPNGLQTEWTTTVATPASAGVLSHIVTSSDFNISGQYSIQAYVRYASSAFRGETAKLKIWEKFE